MKRGTLIDFWGPRAKESCRHEPSGSTTSSIDNENDSTQAGSSQSSPSPNGMMNPGESLTSPQTPQSGI